MSYILDALRRADAERARGTVPGLDAQAGRRPQGADLLGSSSTGWWLAAALGLLLVAGVAVYVWRDRADASKVAEQPQSQARPVSPQTPLIGAVLPAVVPPPLLVQADTRVVVAPTPVAALPAQAGASKALRAETGPSGESAAPVALERLPADIRKSFPELKVGGGMYSPQAASRLVMVNGQVMREGDRLGGGLVIREIRPTAVIFEFRDRLVSVGY
jgi:general secretion pathway protein B